MRGCIFFIIITLLCEVDNISSNRSLGTLPRAPLPSSSPTLTCYPSKIILNCSTSLQSQLSAAQQQQQQTVQQYQQYTQQLLQQVETLQQQVGIEDIYGALKSDSTNTVMSVIHNL